MQESGLQVNCRHGRKLPEHRDRAGG